MSVNTVVDDATNSVETYWPAFTLLRRDRQDLFRRFGRRAIARAARTPLPFPFEGSPEISVALVNRRGVELATFSTRHAQPIKDVLAVRMAQSVAGFSTERYAVSGYMLAQQQDSGMLAVYRDAQLHVVAYPGAFPIYLDDGTLVGAIAVAGREDVVMFEAIAAEAIRGFHPPYTTMGAVPEEYVYRDNISLIMEPDEAATYGNDINDFKQQTTYPRVPAKLL